jgi:DNA-binding MarR family transcriptional regulator
VITRWPCRFSCQQPYRALAEWRHALRRFLSASEAITRAHGVSPTQYQLLLFVRGFPARAPAIEDLAERLQVRHQSAVGLVDRCVKAGLVRRRRDPGNRRRILVETTRRGGELLQRLAAEHYATNREARTLLRSPGAGKTAGSGDGNGKR